MRNNTIFVDCTDKIKDYLKFPEVFQEGPSRDLHVSGIDILRQAGYNEKSLIYIAIFKHFNIPNFSAIGLNGLAGIFTYQKYVKLIVQVIQLLESNKNYFPHSPQGDSNYPMYIDIFLASKKISYNEFIDKHVGLTIGKQGAVLLQYSSEFGNFINRFRIVCKSNKLNGYKTAAEIFEVYGLRHRPQYAYALLKKVCIETKGLKSFIFAGKRIREAYSIGIQEEFGKALKIKLQNPHYNMGHQWRKN